MNIAYLQHALKTLASHRIGIREARTLLALAEGATATEIARDTDEDKTAIRGRIGALKRKGYVLIRYEPDGTIKYSPSKIGAQVINQATA
jgi:hypothetical protein